MGWLVKSVVVMAVALGGCSAPPVIRVAPIPITPAVAGFGEKAMGDVSFLAIRDDVPSGVMPHFGHTGTLAQSGEGTLGDRLFREDEHGFVEACRWVAKGRICDLIVLADGRHLGGGVSWIVPKGAKATPRAGGWVAQTVVVSHATTVNNGVTTMSADPVMIGHVYHCRFAETGAKCIEMPEPVKGKGFRVVGTFSLKDGAVTRDVLWVGVFGTAAAPGAEPTNELHELHRCETTEDSAEISCKLVTMR